MRSKGGQGAERDKPKNLQAQMHNTWTQTKGK